jgi:hypothetical protein
MQFVYREPDYIVTRYRVGDVFKSGSSVCAIVSRRGVPLDGTLPETDGYWVVLIQQPANTRLLQMKHADLTTALSGWNKIAYSEGSEPMAIMQLVKYMGEQLGFSTTF